MVTCQRNEYEGTWHDSWIRMQMARRTTEYGGLHPHWLFFDPSFDSLMGKKYVNDYLEDSDEDGYVVLNVRIHRDRCILLPEELWLCIHGNSYYGQSVADDESFYERTEKYWPLIHGTVPVDIQTEIYQSWDGSLDSARITRHANNRLIEILMETIYMRDVISAFRLFPGAMIYLKRTKSRLEAEQSRKAIFDRDE